MQSDRHSGFKFVDLFAGIGGFHLGMTKAGGQAVYSNEWDRYAADTFENWYRGVQLDRRDIREVDIELEIPRHDVLCAGFPCQPFSLAGVSKKNSLGRKHGFLDAAQGNLFFTICAIIESRKPKIVFLENVKNLISHDSGQTWFIIKRSLVTLGYEVKFEIIDAKSWVPQHRERIYIVAFKRSAFTRSEIDGFKFPSKSRGAPSLSTILERKPDRKYMLSDNLWVYLQKYALKHRVAGNGFGFSIAKPTGQSRTLSARYYKDGSEILIRQRRWRNPRRLTPREAARLMGFDNSWFSVTNHRGGFPQIVSDTQAYRQFGNSVCPFITRLIGVEIARVLELRKTRKLQ